MSEEPVIFTLDPPITKADVPQVCRRLHDTLVAAGGDGGGGRVLCDVSRLGVDTATIELLSRLSLTAKRLGHRFRLRGPSPRLQLLLLVTGLNEILPDEHCDEDPGTTRPNG